MGEQHEGVGVMRGSSWTLEKTVAEGVGGIRKSETLDGDEWNKLVSVCRRVAVETVNVPGIMTRWNWGPCTTRNSGLLGCSERENGYRQKIRDVVISRRPC